jgi:hypothetical protein
MGLYTFADNSMQIVTKVNAGYPCCSAVWSPDGSVFYVAGYEYMMPGSDFWAFDGHTGAATVVIPQINKTEFYNYCFFPTRIGDTFYFFHTETKSEQIYGQSLHMVTSSVSDPTQMTILRGDVPIMDDALWAPDGSFALVLQRLPDAVEPWPGMLLYIPSNTQPTISLISGVHAIKWGD